MEAIVLKAVARELANELPARVQAVQQPSPRELVLLVRGAAERRLLISTDPEAPRLHLLEERPAFLPSPTAFCRLLRKRLEGRVLVRVECPGRGALRHVRFCGAARRNRRSAADRRADGQAQQPDPAGGCDRPGRRLAPARRPADEPGANRAAGAPLHAAAGLGTGCPRCPRRARICGALARDRRESRGALPPRARPRFRDAGSRPRPRAPGAGICGRPGGRRARGTARMRGAGRQRRHPAGLLSRSRGAAPASRPRVGSRAPGRGVLHERGRGGVLRAEDPAARRRSAARRVEPRAGPGSQAAGGRGSAAARGGCRRRGSGLSPGCGGGASGGGGHGAEGCNRVRCSTTRAPAPAGRCASIRRSDRVRTPRRCFAARARSVAARSWRRRNCRRSSRAADSSRRNWRSLRTCRWRRSSNDCRPRSPCRESRRRQRRVESQAAKAAQAPAGIREYRSPEGWRILVGKSGAGNDQLTGRIAAPEDFWFHVRDYPGAHVVLKGAGAQPPDEAIRAAGAVAAWHSGARAERMVDVAYTRRKNVRKVKGGPPGKVILGESATVRVCPGIPETVEESPS